MRSRCGERAVLYLFHGPGREFGRANRVVMPGNERSCHIVGGAAAASALEGNGSGPALCRRASRFGQCGCLPLFVLGAELGRKLADLEIVEPRHLRSHDERDAAPHVGKVEVAKPVDGSLHGRVPTDSIAETERTGDVERVEIEPIWRSIETVCERTKKPKRRRAEHGEPEPFNVGRARIVANLGRYGIDPRINAHDPSMGEGLVGSDPGGEGGLHKGSDFEEDRGTIRERREKEESTVS